MPKTRREAREHAGQKSSMAYVSLVSVVYKATCLIIQERLVKVVEERQLLAEEQGGFKRGRACRDQILT